MRSPAGGSAPGAVAVACIWFISTQLNLRDGSTRFLLFYLAWSLPFTVVLAWATLREARVS